MINASQGRRTRCRVSLWCALRSLVVGVVVMVGRASLGVGVVVVCVGGRPCGVCVGGVVVARCGRRVNFAVCRALVVWWLYRYRPWRGRGVVVCYRLNLGVKKRRRCVAGGVGVVWWYYRTSLTA
jgi:hypothetical protein